MWGFRTLPCRRFCRLDGLWCGRRRRRWPGRSGHHGDLRLSRRFSRKQRSGRTFSGRCRLNLRRWAGSGSMWGRTGPRSWSQRCRRRLMVGTGWPQRVGERVGSGNERGRPAGAGAYQCTVAWRAAFRGGGRGGFAGAGWWAGEVGVREGGWRVGVVVGTRRVVKPLWVARCCWMGARNPSDLPLPQVERQRRWRVQAE